METPTLPPVYGPRCRDEFRAEIARCPDCGVGLVSSLPDPPDPEPPPITFGELLDLRTLLTSSVRNDAEHAARLLLRAELPHQFFELPADHPDAQGDRTTWWRVLVPAAAYREAVAVLQPTGVLGVVDDADRNEEPPAPVIGQGAEPVLRESLRGPYRKAFWVLLGLMLLGLLIEVLYYRNGA